MMMVVKIIYIIIFYILMRIQDINFFYINCKKDSFKNMLIQSQWDNCCLFFDQKIHLQRIDAIHFLDYCYPYYTEYNIPHNSKIKDQVSNIAVFKSHTNLWKHILDNKIKFSLIFEDDAIIPQTFLNDLQNILNDPFVQEFNNWDILYLGILRLLAQKIPQSQNFLKMLPNKGYNNGLHCYILNLHSIPKLLKLITNEGASNQIDLLLRDNANKFNFFIYKDLLIKQDVDKLESTRLGRFVKEELKQTFNEINIIS